MVRSIFGAAALLLLLPALAQAAPEIRFCPAGQVRTYPAEDQRHLDSLLLQNAAIVNADAAPLHVDAITIELLQGNAVVDQRRIAGPMLDRLAAGGKALQASGLMTLAAFQFCGHALIDSTVTLGGPELKPREALLVPQQAFVFQGPRDALRVRVEGREGNAPVNASAEIPIRSELSKNAYLFPLRGVWYAGNGPTFYTAHRWAIPEEFAFDIVKLDAGGLTHTGDGTHFADYYDYGAKVRAAADGTVVLAHDGEREDAGVMRQPGESQEAYFARLQGDQAGRLQKGTFAMAGNVVMIDHGGGEYSMYAHLKPGSVKVRAGDAVKAGQVIANLGSTGNSTEPHLHFQLCDRPDPLMCAGIPIRFIDIEIPFADLPRAVQSGDIVIAR